MQRLRLMFATVFAIALTAVGLLVQSWAQSKGFRGTARGPIHPGARTVLNQPMDFVRVRVPAGLGAIGPGAKNAVSAGISGCSRTMKKVSSGSASRTF